MRDAIHWRRSSPLIIAVGDEREQPRMGRFTMSAEAEGCPI
jgi:hypothetical protein